MFLLSNILPEANEMGLNGWHEFNILFFILERDKLDKVYFL